MKRSNVDDRNKANPKTTPENRPKKDIPAGSSPPRDLSKAQPFFRVTLQLSTRKPRIDQVLLEELRIQNRNLALRNISRSEFKELFKRKKIRIKGQSAVPSSSLASGTTHVDIFGFEEDLPLAGKKPEEDK